MTNKEVTQAFSRGDTAKVQNLTSEWSINPNNLLLISYWATVAIKVDRDVFITTTGYSLTTTAHTNLALNACYVHNIWEVEDAQECRWYELKDLFIKALEYQGDNIKDLEKQLKKPKIRVQTKERLRALIDTCYEKLDEIQARLKDFE